MPATRTVVVRACRQYFRTLRQDYNAQGSTAVRAKKDRKNTMNSRRNRRKKVSFSTETSQKHTHSFKQKCDERRKAIPHFQAIYGEDETVGLESILLTDYQSSEHSDIGAVPEVEYKNHRRRQGAGDHGLERRREEWRSPLVSMMSVIVIMSVLKEDELNSSIGCTPD
jgi:hypothetical protein